MRHRTVPAVRSSNWELRRGKHELGLAGLLVLFGTRPGYGELGKSCGRTCAPRRMRSAVSRGGCQWGSARRKLSDRTSSKYDRLVVRRELTTNTLSAGVQVHVHWVQDSCRSASSSSTIAAAAAADYLQFIILFKSAAHQPREQIRALRAGKCVSQLSSPQTPSSHLSAASRRSRRRVSVVVQYTGT